MNNTQTNPHKYKRGTISKIFSLPLMVFAWCITALILNIFLEFIGPLFKWWPAGTGHSKQMLVKEMVWLNNNFSGLISNPTEVAVKFNKWLHQALFVWNDTDLLAYLVGTSIGASMYEIIVTVLTIIKVFGVRLVVILFSMPVFMMFAVVAFVDGMMMRDLRKWGGGRESSYLWHIAKSWLKPAIALPVIVYLGSPVSIHPSYIVLPFAFVFAIAIWYSSTMFKKYL